ncbi:MAG: pantoate--beta-alanine ligase [Candidatus Aminicenantales bacterium]
MKIISSVKEMKAAARKLKEERKVIGFVPTMGYVHQGHLSLVRQSVKETDATVVSIFVNPTQFGPQEDFKEYPRDLERDLKILNQEGVVYVFSPREGEIYPRGYRTYVEVHGLQHKLCGKTRPTHFRGVCTVVLKLFNIVSPEVAYFGQKDAQQALILKRMVKDLNLDVEIRVMPIVRENDGLALSSRNEYLSPKERKAALVLHRSLLRAKELIKAGERQTSVLIEEMEKLIQREKLARIDYVEIVDLEELGQLDIIKDEALAAIAVYVGKTRLIDNMIVSLKKGKVEFRD